MKKIALFFAVSVMIAAASCGGDSAKTASVGTQPEAVAVPAGESIVGEWRITEIVCGDSIKIIPSQLLPDVDVTMTFNADETFYAATGCNSVSGSYASRGGSIKFGDAMMTEMACEHMEVEDALRVMLPDLEYCEFTEGGSEAVLKGASGGCYIKLSRIKVVVPQASE